MKMKNLLLATALLTTASTAVMAGQGWHITIHNRTADYYTIQGNGGSCWYGNHDRIVIKPGTAHKIYSEEKNSGGCYANWLWSKNKHINFELKNLYRSTRGGVVNFGFFKIRINNVPVSTTVTLRNDREACRVDLSGGSNMYGSNRVSCSATYGTRHVDINISDYQISSSLR